MYKRQVFTPAVLVENQDIIAQDSTVNLYNPYAAVNDSLVLNQSTMNVGNLTTNPLHFTKFELNDGSTVNINSAAVDFTTNTMGRITADEYAQAGEGTVVNLNSINVLNKLIMSKETLAKTIREIPDFPIPGILFYDVTTLFKNPSALQELSDTLYEMYKDKGITKVVGIESRGFIMGPILATRLGAGFVPMRKPGKLPAETIEESYDKEYGKDTVQIHKDAIEPDDVVLLHDDLLATGGTMEAACKLVKKLNPKKVYVNFIIELKELHGKEIFSKDVDVESVLTL